ncbi:Serine/threonine protein kinase [Trachipleistophora hominis]|uniref:Serine/threonine protein kinase n=1 Tax=Trachipleistophora hominis TaxID=72359 RepID=L7JYE7_TRAHO|nr:Serine/threonine protein kinase [Trachipleistophora hominis]
MCTRTTMRANSSSSLDEIYEDTNSENIKTENGLDTEHEDAEQQRLSGYKGECVDEFCSGKCQSADRQSNGDSTVLDKHGYVCADRMLNERRIKEYTLLRTLGKGSFSKVKLAASPDGQHVAIKIIPRNLRYNSINKESRCKREERIYREAIITALVCHPHIIKLRAFFYNDLHFYMVYEYVSGRSLLNCIRENGVLDEQLARKFFTQIVDAVNFMHSNAIVHRDLKIENILIDKGGNIKIIDFGLSNFYDSKQFLGTFCGSLQFAAPELLRGRVYTGPEVDMWSLGVILYVMVVGTLPFDDKDVSILHSKIKKGRFAFRREVSASARKLIGGLIESDAKKRYRMRDVLKSDWLNERSPSQTKHPQNEQQYAHTHPYMNPTVTSMTAKMRAPNSFNSAFIDVLRKVGGKAFENTGTDMQACADDVSMLSCIRPTIKMYRLLESHFSNKELPRFVVTGSRKESLHRLVSIMHNDCPRLNLIPTTNIVQPKVKVQNTLLKGIFTGISCNNVDNSERLGKTIHRFFKLHRIKTMADEDHYSCLLKMEGMYVEFSLAFYFNVVIKKHYVCVRKRHGSRTLFDTVVVWLKEVLGSTDN